MIDSRGRLGDGLAFSWPHCAGRIIRFRAEAAMGERPKVYQTTMIRVGGPEYIDTSTSCLKALEHALRPQCGLQAGGRITPE